MARTSEEPRGLPGGIFPPAASLILMLAGFGYLFTHPELLDVGGTFSPAGLCVLGAVISLGWLLVAIGKRPPPDPR